MTYAALQIKANVPIEAVIGRYLRLKSRGKDLIGLCPFHSEKTPSFIVHPGQHYFKCFGCGAAGDVISFVQRIEGVEFSQAVRSLAEEFGVTLDPAGKRLSKADRRRNANYAAEGSMFWFLVTKRLWSELKMADAAIDRIVDWACSDDYDESVDASADLCASEIVRDRALKALQTIWAASTQELASAYLRIRDERLAERLRHRQRRTGLGILLAATDLPEGLRDAIDARRI